MRSGKLSSQSQAQEFFDQSYTVRVQVTDSVVKGLFLDKTSPTNVSWRLRLSSDTQGYKFFQIGKFSEYCLEDARAIARDIIRAESLPENNLMLRDYVLEYYMPHIRVHKKGWKIEQSIIRKHVLPVFGRRLLSELSFLELTKFINLHREKYKPGFTNLVIFTLRSIFNYAVDVEILQKSPFSERKLKIFKANNERDRYLSEEEVGRLMRETIKSTNRHLYPLVCFLLLTGARKREAFNAKFTDFDLEARLWRIQENKSGKTRHVPLSDTSIELIKTHRQRFKRTDYLFYNERTLKPFRTIFNSFNTARLAARLPEIRVHDLRHSFASFLVNSGCQIYEVQKILGHKDIKSTQRYAHLANETLVQATNKASAFVKMIDADPR